jgi:hypothetical protein
MEGAVGQRLNYCKPTLTCVCVCEANCIALYYLYYLGD